MNTQLNTINKTFKATVCKYHNAMHSTADKVANTQESMNALRQVVRTDKKDAQTLRDGGKILRSSYTLKRLESDIAKNQQKIDDFSSALSDFKDKAKSDIDTMKKLFTDKISRKDYKDATTDDLCKVYVAIFKDGGIDLQDDILSILKDIATSEKGLNGAKCVEKSALTDRITYNTWVDLSARKMADILQSKGVLPLHKYEFVPKSLRK